MGSHNKSQGENDRLDRFAGDEIRIRKTIKMRAREGGLGEGKDRGGRWVSDL